MLAPIFMPKVVFGVEGNYVVQSLHTRFKKRFGLAATRRLLRDGEIMGEMEMILER